MKKIIQVSIAAALIAATGSAAAWWDGPGLGGNRGWRSTPDGDGAYGINGIHNPYDPYGRYYPYGRYDPYGRDNRYYSPYGSGYSDDS